MHALHLPHYWSVFLLVLLRCLAFTPALVGASPRHSYAHHHYGKLFQHDDLNLDMMASSSPEWKVKTSEEHQGGVDYEKLNKTLVPLTFKPLPLGTIKPRGWFRQQLELMADGLPGHMDEFYHLIKDATWGGGHSEYSFLNEAWPYYINGLVPLAFSLDDRVLIDKISQQISFVLLRQFSDGWLGPEDQVHRRNFWGRYPFFLAAAQFVEAAGPAESEQMLKAMHRFVSLMHTMLKDDYQGYIKKDGDDFDEQWGRSRASDMVLSLQWLYENHPENNGAKIHECMFLIYQKAFDWSWWFRDDIFLKEDIESYPADVIDPLFPYLHVVNTGQGLKSPAVMGRLVHDKSLFESSRRGVELTFNYHGVSSGAIVGDERMSGRSPSRGAELCGVVETMYSLSTLYQILGDASLADRLEAAAFNAMPAMIMPRWWAHQYVAQINQPHSYDVPNTHFWNVGAWGITFGLEPNYPCCTVNHPQGYPKLLSNSWVRTPRDNGLAHVVLIPSEVTLDLPGKHASNRVNIKCETNYPFTHHLTYHIEAQEGFNFSFRVPPWVNLNNPETGITLETDTNTPSTNTGDQKPIQPPPQQDPQPLKPNSHTGLHTVTLPAGPLKFSVNLSPYPSRHGTRRPQIHKRPNGAISITHGALLFAHSLPATYIPRRPANYQGPHDAPPESSDWTIVPRLENPMPSDPDSHNPTSIPWNIAIDPSTVFVHEYPALHADPDAANSAFPNPIWAEGAPPVSVSALACEIEWNMTDPVQYETGENGEKRAVRGGYPLPPPQRKGEARHKCAGRAFPVELRPFGSAKIRMAEFPVVDLRPGSRDLDDGEEDEDGEAGNDDVEE